MSPIPMRIALSTKSRADLLVEVLPVIGVTPATAAVISSATFLGRRRLRVDDQTVAISLTLSLSRRGSAAS